jgi:intraflagellar transport protein 122
MKKINSSLLEMAAKHFITCLEKLIQVYDLKGLVTNEWLMESPVKFLKVVGGPAGKETILAGLKNGNAYRMYIDNPFPMLLIKHDVSIRELDMNLNRTRLAVVDDNKNLTIYDIQSKEVKY